MKKVLSLVAVLAAGSLVLTGCGSKTENVEEVAIDETPAVEETSNTKTSLDLGDLISITETNFPKSYTFTKYNMTTEEREDEGRHVYNRMELGYLTPDHANMIDRKVTESGFEDGIIKTVVEATLEDGRIIYVTYVVDPTTLKFLAANVEDGDITTNYQFSYDNITSLTYEDLEGIAEMNFPSGSTYTVTDLTTEEATEGENLYHEDTPHNLINITPEYPATTSRELLSSGIQDGMIYTDFDVTFDNGTTGNVLYINDPETLNFVATNVESEGVAINHQYIY